jgi:hypothetical protein
MCSTRPATCFSRRRGAIEVSLAYALRQVFSSAAAFGPLRTFVAVRTPATARGEGAVLESPAPWPPFPRAVAAPPFSGPRSRGTTAARNAQLHQHQPSAATARTPRMGPAPGGTTTALLPPTVTGDAPGCTPAARAGGSGYGRRSHSRCPGPCRAWLELMAPRLVVHIGCSASVDRRTYPGPPALAPTHGCIADGQRTASGRKQPFTMHRHSTRRGSSEAPWSH